MVLEKNLTQQTKTSKENENKFGGVQLGNMYNIQAWNNKTVQQRKKALKDKISL